MTDPILLQARELLAAQFEAREQPWSAVHAREGSFDDVAAFGAIIEALRTAQPTAPPVSAVTAQLIARDQAGRKKYGTTLDRQDLSHADWLQHMAEELLDAAGYALAAKDAALRQQPAEAGKVVPVAYADPQAFKNFARFDGSPASTKEWMWAKPDAGLVPLYTAAPALPEVTDLDALDACEVYDKQYIGRHHVGSARCAGMRAVLETYRDRVMGK